MLMFFRISCLLVLLVINVLTAAFTNAEVSKDTAQAGGTPHKKLLFTRDTPAKVKSKNAPTLPAPQTGFTVPPQPLPKNGEIFSKNSLRAIAPLQIVTRNRDYHYFVKVADWKTNKSVKMLFLRSGKTVTTKVPIGTYSIKYATGKTWYGENYLFGPETLYNKADKKFVFQRKGNRISGYRVELILQTDGNLGTRRIPKAKW